LSAADFVKVISVQQLSPALKSLAPRSLRCARRRSGSARAIGRGAAWLTLSLRATIRAMAPIPRLRRTRGKLRLDFNETPSVLAEVIECVQKYLTADHLTIYPEYQEPAAIWARSSASRPRNSPSPTAPTKPSSF
jgi:hypothetical protein